MNFEKTVMLKRFQKAQLQSVSIVFKFVYPCVNLYLLLYLFSCSELLFLCFTENGGVSHSLNFDFMTKFFYASICTHCVPTICRRHSLDSYPSESCPFLLKKPIDDPTV